MLSCQSAARPNAVRHIIISQRSNGRKSLASDVVPIRTGIGGLTEAVSTTCPSLSQFTRRVASLSMLDSPYRAPAGQDGNRSLVQWPPRPGFARSVASPASTERCPTVCARSYTSPRRHAKPCKLVRLATNGLAGPPALPEAKRSIQSCMWPSNRRSGHEPGTHAMR
jgi:hypothetical protein